MDFASLMAAELAKGKPRSSSASTSTSSTKQADVEAARVAAYKAEQARVAAARESKARAKRQREEDVAEQDRQREEKRQRLATEARARREEREREEEKARRKRLGLPQLPDPTDDGREEEEITGNSRFIEIDEEVGKLSTDEIIARLRTLSQPKTLFGETAALRTRRLILHLRKAASSALSTQRGPIPTTLEFVPEQDMKVSGTMPPAPDRTGRTWVFRQLVSFFSMVLEEYERAMENERRDTLASKAAYNVMVQCRENMRPVSAHVPQS